MPSIYRVSIGFPFDSALPKDVITLNPHYIGDNPQALADALKANLVAKSEVGARPFTVKVYDAEKAPPSYPLGAASQAGTTPVHNGPRELAVCLSYYGLFNRPRYRGRLFIPVGMLGTVTFGLRPTAGMIAAALAWRTVFQNNLPSGHNWCVYSKMGPGATVITNCWVDDEWDVMRSRGLRPTTRSTAP